MPELLLTADNSGKSLSAVDSKYAYGNCDGQFEIAVAVKAIAVLLE
jgi:hypothetical protein